MMGHAAADHLDTLYRRYGPAIHRRACAILKDEDEALDVTQDTFLAYMRSESSLSGAASAFTVLYQIATYKAVDRVRRNSRWSGVLGSLDISEEEAVTRAAAWVSSNEGGLARVEALRDIAILTDGEQRQTLTVAVLYYIEGYTMGEIGKTLDLDRKQVSELLRQFAERAQRRSARQDGGGRS